MKKKYPDRIPIWYKESDLEKQPHELIEDLRRDVAIIRGKLWASLLKDNQTKTDRQENHQGTTLIVLKKLFCKIDKQKWRPETT